MDNKGREGGRGGKREREREKREADRQTDRQTETERGQPERTCDTERAVSMPSEHLVDYLHACKNRGSQGNG